MIETLLKVIYPHRCMLCRDVIEEQEGCYFCERCYHKYISEMPNRMASAGKDIPTILEIAASRLQEEEIPEIIGVFPLFPYTSEYRRAVLRWKYTGLRRYAKGFAEILVNETHLFEHIKLDALIPVPLAPSRMRKRGFNQAVDLAREISLRTGIEVLECLSRCRDTKPQAVCNLEERYLNARGSMICQLEEEKAQKDINNIAIIDDIYTTGSTVKECCRALREHSTFRNIKVYVIVVTKGEI